MELILCHN